jgi:hypothetical protein
MSILSALTEFFVGGAADIAADKWTGSLTQDYRNDPVYNAKLHELIERNKVFEEERDRSSRSGSGSNEQNS